MALQESIRYFNRHRERMSSMFPSLQNIVDRLTTEPQLSHASNILGKAVKLQGSHNQNHIDVLNRLIERYLVFLTELEGIHTYEQENFVQRANIIDDYYDFFEREGIERTFDARGKIRSSVLEEFTYLFLKDRVNTIIADKCGEDYDDIICGAVDAYSNLYITGKNINTFVQNPLVRINGKKQDYAIYCTFSINVSHNGRHSGEVITNVPILAIENKTFLDKTMLEGAIATAEKLKSGNTYSAFIVITETYAVAEDVDPIYSRIDQIFVLRKCKHDKSNRTPHPIDPGVLKKILEFVSKHLNSTWSDVNNRVLTDGVVMS